MLCTLQGEEVFNTYGQLGNCQLLHMYGFTEAYPNNHYDTVSVYTDEVTTPVKLHLLFLPNVTYH